MNKTDYMSMQRASDMTIREFEKGRFKKNGIQF